MDTAEKMKLKIDAVHVEALQDQLADLASEWRSTHDPRLVNEYQSILRRLIASGWKSTLDYDEELPDEYMPEEYLKLHR